MPTIKDVAREADVGGGTLIAGKAPVAGYTRQGHVIRGNWANGAKALPAILA